MFFYFVVSLTTLIGYHILLYFVNNFFNFFYKFL